MVSIVEVGLKGMLEQRTKKSYEAMLFPEPTPRHFPTNDDP
ncbi:unnamed protein product [Brassica rapa subsp. trilocularis]